MTIIPDKLTLVAERSRMAAVLIEAALSRGWKVEHDRQEDRCRTLRFEGPRLSVLVHLQGGRTDMPPLLHGHSAKGKLRMVRGAWQSVNGAHFHKATSYPASLEGLAHCFANGIDAANNGSAFDPEGP